MKKVKAITALFSTIFLASFILMFWWSCETEKVGLTDWYSGITQLDYFISGYIFDINSNQPLQGATIQIGETIILESNKHGFFTTDEILDTGEYRVKISKENYITMFRALEISENVIRYNLNYSIVERRPSVIISADVGGKVVSENKFGKYELEIPSGALTNTTEISITPTINSGTPFKNRDELFLINSVSLDPPGLEFNQSILFSVPIVVPEEIINPDSVFVVNYNSETSESEIIGLANIIESSNSMEIEISHFSNVDFLIPFANPQISLGLAFDDCDGTIDHSTSSLSHTFWADVGVLILPDGLPEEVMWANVPWIEQTKKIGNDQSCSGIENGTVTVCCRIQYVNFDFTFNNATIGRINYPFMYGFCDVETDGGSGSSGGNGD